MCRPVMVRFWPVLRGVKKRNFIVSLILYIGPNIFFSRREMSISLLYLLLENTTFIVGYLHGLGRLEQNPNFYIFMHTH